MSTTKTTADVEWDAPSSSGKCNITSYHLSINSGFGSDSFSLIDDTNIANKPYLTNATIDLSSFTPGQFYEVKLTVVTQDTLNSTSKQAAFLLAGVPTLSTTTSVIRDKERTSYNATSKAIHLGLTLPQVADNGGVALQAF